MGLVPRGQRRRIATILSTWAGTLRARMTVVRATAAILLGSVCLVGCVKPLTRDEGEPPDAATAGDDAPQNAVPRSCRDALQHGVVSDGVVTIDPDGAGPMQAFAVYCDMRTAGGGW